MNRILRPVARALYMPTGVQNAPCNIKPKTRWWFLLALTLVLPVPFVIMGQQSAHSASARPRMSTVKASPLSEAPAPVVEETPAETAPAEPAPDIEPLEPEVFLVPVTLYNANTHESEEFELPLSGALDEETAQRLAEFMMCRRTRKVKPIDPGVVAILADLAMAYPDHVIEVVSGYRSPPYGVRNSKHFIGHAVDLRVRGVKLRHIRDYLWRTHREVGVGYYPSSRFVHVDYRPGEHDAAWTSTDDNAPYRYNPRWAQKARHGLRQLNDMM